MDRTSFLTSEYAAILRYNVSRGNVGEVRRLLNNYKIGDELVYPIIDRPAYKPFVEG